MTRTTKLTITALCWTLAAIPAAPAPGLSPWLNGLHWYRTDGDAEDLTGGKGVWLLETVMVWEGSWSPSAQKSKFATAVSRGHTIVCRLQPWWGYAVPPEEQMADYLGAVAVAAETLKNECHIWQIGNEMNGLNEYGGQYLQPAVYVDRFKRIRAAIKSVSSPLGEQLVFLGPPGVLSDYWYSMLALVGPGDFDGFTMHAYNAGPSVLDVNRNIETFMEQMGGQMAFIDSASGLTGPPGVFKNKPVLVTEFDRCNDPANDPAQEECGSRSLYGTYQRLNDWNLRQGNYAGMETHPVTAAVWFIYPEADSNWDCYSLVVHKAGPRGRKVNLWDAFQYAATLNLPAGATPVLSVTPTQITRQTVPGTPTPDDTFTVINTWTGSMGYTVQESCAWLDVSPASGSSSGEADTITVSYYPAGLPTGQHSTTITIDAGQTAASPKTVSVTITVQHKPADFDGDGDVDQSDFGQFQTCLTAIGQCQDDPACQAARFDLDCDVDIDDFARFQACMSGPDVPSNPLCNY